MCESAEDREDELSGRPDQARCLMSATLCPVRPQGGSDTRESPTCHLGSRHAADQTREKVINSVRDARSMSSVSSPVDTCALNRTRPN